MVGGLRAGCPAAGANPCLSPPACSQASRRLRHPDHRRCTARRLLQQEPCCAAAACAELQGKGLGLILASPAPPFPIPSPISHTRVPCSAVAGRQDLEVLMQLPREPIFLSLALD